MIKKFKDLLTGELFTIDQLAQKALDENWFPEADSKGTLHYVKTRIRCLANQKSSETGLPEFVSISEVQEDGSIVRGYKSGISLTLTEYRNICKYHKEQILHHAAKQKQYRKECIEKFGEDPINQLEMDFEFNQALKTTDQLTLEDAVNLGREAMGNLIGAPK